ncbi:sialidase family protein [Aeoliella sp. SH292]|uniref:sialidase family protein n=1 Tax=Aeoliella sp. SH292 TaxID=3454464 RepID=UPI003F94EA44
MTRLSFLALLAVLAAASFTHAGEVSPCEYTLELDVVSEGFDKKTCWVHPRAGILPAGTPGAPTDHPAVVLTLNKLRIDGMDTYSEIFDMRSDDLGRTWTAPSPHAESLGHWPTEEGGTRSIGDFTPKWHAKSGKLLGTGHTVWYTADGNVKKVRPRHTAYSVYDPVARTWSRRQDLQMPDDPRFANAGAGCTQRYDLPDGDILLPIYFKEPGGAQASATVVRASFDGETLKYLEHGTELTIPNSRGFGEPSITKYKDKYFLTLRNDLAGYVATSDDGLHIDEPRKWTFDDGTELGSYNTQQHWVTHSNGLFLVYTRRGANNDHVFRHRAPLFMAQVDPERLCVIRDTEQILVPEKGARLGNFGVCDISPNETWVTTAEWMQTTGPNPRDWRVPMKYGSDNRVYVARIKWHEPNELVP